MSSINASYAGCWSIQFTDNICFSITHPCFSAYGNPNIDWQVRFQTAAWKFSLCKCFCKASCGGGSWWHWVFLLFTKQRNRTSLISPIDEKAHMRFSTSRRMPFGMSKLSPTLENVWWTFTSSAEPVRIFHSTVRPTRFGVFTLQRVTSYMMSCANEITCLLVASDISTDKFEMGRSDWSSVRTQAIKLHNKFSIVIDCSFINLPVVGAMELTIWLLTKSISG
jgi:hypothetical protein